MCRTNLNSVKYAKLCRKHWMLDQTSNTVFLIFRSDQKNPSFIQMLALFDSICLLSLMKEEMSL